MARKTQAQQIAEAGIILFLIGIAVVGLIVTALIKNIKHHPAGSLFLLLLAISGIVAWLINKNKKKKEKEDISTALRIKFKNESEILLKLVQKWNKEGLLPIENTNIKLPKEKIFFQEPFEWKNVGGNKENTGYLYITDKSIRYISESSHQIKFEKIMRFEYGNYFFKIYPDNGKAILFVPKSGEVEFDQRLIVARFFAIWKIADGYLFRDFSQDFCNILGINAMEKEQQNENN